MAESQITTKAALLAEIERAWTTLTTAIDHLTEDQLTIPQDAQGWTAKDHLIHLIAWERSVIFPLRGQTRYEGLGVTASVYFNDNFDEINDVIYQQHKHLSLVDTLAQLHDTHQQLLALLQPLSDNDLNKPFHHYLPDESEDGDEPPIIDVIYGNTADHFVEHLNWIETLVGSA
ncbi:MAG: ClbS/DfsB family four-helix bundle protein [Anaerolineae bacterium]